MEKLFDAVLACLQVRELDAKLERTSQVARAWSEGSLDLDSDAEPLPFAEAGRPTRPELVPPRQVPRRSFGSPEGRAALLHAVAHIEFNAINLAWDAVYRFRGLPRAYYDDWVRIADEERQHFELVQSRLATLGFGYGDFPAHGGLWESARKTADDPLLRMALVPRVLEARGLDVNPAMMKKLTGAGDLDSVAVLEVILRDEIGHVAAGTRWFQHLCAERGLDPEPTFAELVRAHMRGAIRGPFYDEGRRQAGFSETELQMLRELDGRG